MHRDRRDAGTELARVAEGHRWGRRAARWGAVGAAALLAAGFGAYVRHNLTGLRKGMEAVAAAGFVERKVNVGGHDVNFAEGPRNGPPLLLIHGQCSQWQDHMLVLPQLAAQHHVFVVDVPGHGGSDRLPPTSYTCVDVARVLAGFMEATIGGPAIVSGHSSGGLLALWLAAERGDLVSGLVLEDPPLFSSTMPRLVDSTGGDGLAVAHRYLAEGGPGDYQAYFVEHSQYFSFFGRLADPIRDYALGRARGRPGEPVTIWFLPPTVTVFFQGLVNYDPAFGAAWIDDIWYRDFDTDTALAAVDVPTTLIHTNFFENREGTAYTDSGFLRAAMDRDDVARALKHLPKETPLIQIQSGHLVHFERPAPYLEAVRGLTERVHG
ncbi:alpha/beta hydrolase [Spiractinospora alimapuensis]|uniref:alpha/beta hydrolase n=1 Tax=Spiractinospora alimapuensis TaxID=2820884 RepID=UPI001F3FF8D4|nr:alpha/beta hydrolase [Spiractinospora alimapuensis]QVQ52784.1 alpha/beta hydrolase [Spiractinospora alimapuensis]